MDLTLIMDSQDINYILNDRPNTLSWIYIKDSHVHGIVNAVKADLLSPTHRRVNGSILDHIYLNGLDEIEIFRILRSVFNDSFWDGIDIITVNNTGYFNSKIIKIGWI